MTFDNSTPDAQFQAIHDFAVKYYGTDKWLPKRPPFSIPSYVNKNLPLNIHPVDEGGKCQHYNQRPDVGWCNDAATCVIYLSNGEIHDSCDFHYRVDNWSSKIIKMESKNEVREPYTT